MVVGFRPAAYVHDARVPVLKSRPAIAAAFSAGAVALVAYSLPYRLGIILAALVGIAVGTFLEGRKSPEETL